MVWCGLCVLICGIGEMLGLVVPSVANMSACVLVVVYASLCLWIHVGPYFLDCRFIGEPSDDMYHEIYEDFL